MGYCGDRRGAAVTPVRLIERACHKVEQHAQTRWSGPVAQETPS